MFLPIPPSRPPPQSILPWRVEPFFLVLDDPSLASSRTALDSCFDLMRGPGVFLPFVAKFGREVGA